MEILTIPCFYIISQSLYKRIYLPSHISIYFHKLDIKEKYLPSHVFAEESSIFGIKLFSLSSDIYVKEKNFT